MELIVFLFAGVNFYYCNLLGNNDIIIHVISEPSGEQISHDSAIAMQYINPYFFRSGNMIGLKGSGHLCPLYIMVDIPMRVPWSTRANLSLLPVG